MPSNRARWLTRLRDRSASNFTNRLPSLIN